MRTVFGAPSLAPRLHRPRRRRGARANAPTPRIHARGCLPGMGRAPAGDEGGRNPSSCGVGQGISCCFAAHQLRGIRGPVFDDTARPTRPPCEMRPSPLDGLRRHHRGVAVVQQHGASRPIFERCRNASVHWPKGPVCNDALAAKAAGAAAATAGGDGVRGWLCASSCAASKRPRIHTNALARTLPSGSHMYV